MRKISHVVQLWFSRTPRSRLPGAAYLHATFRVPAGLDLRGGIGRHHRRISPRATRGNNEAKNLTQSPPSCQGVTSQPAPHCQRIGGSATSQRPRPRTTTPRSPLERWRCPGPPTPLTRRYQTHPPSCRPSIQRRSAVRLRLVQPIAQGPASWRLHGADNTSTTSPTRRYQPHPLPWRIAMQAGAQILTYRQPSRVSRLGAGVWGAAVHHKGAGFQRAASSPWPGVWGGTAPEGPAPAKAQKQDAAPPGEKKAKRSESTCTSVH